MCAFCGDDDDPPPPGPPLERGRLLKPVPLKPRPEPGVTYRTVKGALLGPGSGIETPEQADRIVNALRGRPCCHTTGPNHHPACTTNRTEPCE